MKKKNKPIDPFSQLQTASSVHKKLKEIFEGPKIDYTAPPIRVKDDSDKYVLKLEKLDDWCEKWLEKNKDVKSIKGEYYPYKDYTAIDDLLHKHGKELIDRVLKECPLKGRELKHEIYDSLAFNIFRKKIDPRSLFTVPTYKSFWDKISDHGHA